MYYTSALSDPQRFNQKLQIHTWRTFCHTHITTSIYINVLGLSRHNSFMPYVGSSWLPRVMMRQSGSSMKKAKSNMKISQAFGPDTGGQITRFRLQSTLYKLTFHMELHLCICRCVYMLEKHTVYLFNYLFVYEFIKSRTQTHTHTISIYTHTRKHFGLNWSAALRCDGFWCPSPLLCRPWPSQRSNLISILCCLDSYLGDGSWHGFCMIL